MLKHTVRAGRVVAGVLLLIVGIILSLPMVPGPGILFVVGGLSCLSHEFEWARRLRDWAHAEYRRVVRGRNAG